MASIRKRWRETRLFDRKPRPKTPAPKDGWLIAELSQLTGITIRTLRNYIAAGLLTPTSRRGTATRYARRELLRLLAVMRARKESNLRLAEVKKQLDNYDEAKLEEWLRSQPIPPAAALALGFPPAPPRQGSLPSAEPPSLERWQAQVQGWQRIQLLPGLELMLGPNPSVAAQRAAAKICTEYLG